MSAFTLEESVNVLRRVAAKLNSHEEVYYFYHALAVVTLAMAEQVARGEPDEGLLRLLSAASVNHAERERL